MFSIVYFRRCRGEGEEISFFGGIRVVGWKLVVPKDSTRPVEGILLFRGEAVYSKL